MPAVLETPDSPPGSSVHSLQDELLGMLQRAGQPPAVERCAAAPVPCDVAPTEVNERGKRPVSAKAAGQTAAAVEEAVDPNVTCVKCGNTQTWGQSSWCPKCGYYPSLGHNGETPLEETDGLENLTMADLCPAWALQLVGGVIVIVVLTGVLQRVLDGNLGFLSLASLVQLSFGLVLVLLAHKQAIMSGLQDPGCPGVLSLIAYPPSVWMPVFKHLQARSHLLVTLAWGLAASGSALGIYGPIHMEEIKKEIAERRKEPQKPLMGRMLGTMTKLAVAGSQAANGGQAGGLPPGADGSLEDAIGGFAGLATEQGGLGDIAAAAANGRVDGPVGDIDVSGIGDGGGSGAGGKSIDGAISNFAGLAVGQTGLDDPTKLAGVIAAGGAGGAGELGAGGAVAGGGGDLSSRGGTGDARLASRTDTGSASGVPSFVSAPDRDSSSRSSQSAAGRTTAAAIVPDTTPVIVFGYLTNAGGDIRTLLIARTGPDGRPRFAGRLSSEAVGTSRWASLAAELPALRTQRPLVACPNAGQWVQPKIVLSVKADRWSSTGPIDAQVTGLERR